MKNPIPPWLDVKTAPNGRPIRDNFQDWFGKSRARDPNGEPLVLYHGTSASFDAFSLASHRSVLNNDYQGDGFHFTPSARVAWDYADSARNQFINKDRIFELVDQKMPPLGAQIFKSVTTIGFDRAWDIPDDQIKATMKACEDAEIDINMLLGVSEWVEGSNYHHGRESTFEASSIFGGPSSLPEWVREDAVVLGLQDALPNPCTVPVFLQINRLLKTDSREKARQAQANGYDGVFYFGEDTVRDEPEWIVFRPEQIKSAIGNNGLYLKGSASLTDVDALDLQAHERAGKPVAIDQARRALDLVQSVTKEKSRAQTPVA